MRKKKYTITLEPVLVHLYKKELYKAGMLFSTRLDILIRKDLDVLRNENEKRTK